MHNLRASLKCYKNYLEYKIIFKLLTYLGIGPYFECWSNISNNQKIEFWEDVYVYK